MEPIDLLEEPQGGPRALGRTLRWGEAESRARPVEAPNILGLAEAGAARLGGEPQVAGRVVHFCIYAGYILRYVCVCICVYIYTHTQFGTIQKKSVHIYIYIHICMILREYMCPLVVVLGMAFAAGLKPSCS